jgi:hypothetical protein
MKRCVCCVVLMRARRLLLACTCARCVRSLYVDPKEQHSALIRNLPFIDMFQRAANVHAETFKRFPPKKVVTVARVSESQGTRRRAR